MKIVNLFIILFFILNSKAALSNDFNKWLTSFKEHALTSGVSEKTFNKVMLNVKFLPKVIEYDRYQPEFYEDTFTYIAKRASKKKVQNGNTLYTKNKKIINIIEKKYNVEKELLLALMGVETNYGTYLGKMDIISSLATLSFDKRRSKFFTNELITILKLVDKKLIDHNILFGSWAGAYGNFQFMPTTIQSYAVDHNKDNKVDLKSIEDSFASAANYISSIGWKKNQPCFYPIDLGNNIPKKFLNSSAQKIKNKKKLKYFKKYIKNYDKINIKENTIVSIITPDKDIVENAELHKPAYLIFNNYELILKWNRSLRFALAVCTLKDKFKNEI